MKHVPLAALESKIIRPGFESRLTPLLMYRGRVTLGRVHRLWNALVSAMEHEASHADITQRMVHNPECAQLCGPEKPLTFMGLRSFCGRLLDNPKVMAEMPGLQEYIEWMLPEHKRGFQLDRVSEITHRSRNTGVGGWRTFVDRRVGKRPTPEHFANWAKKETNEQLQRRFGVSYPTIKRWREETGTKRQYFAPRPAAVEKSLVYPFLIHDGGRPEHVLMKRIARAVPRSLSEDMRADLCQDLIVGILSGEIAEDDLALPMRELLAKAWKDKMESRTGFLSLDSMVPGTTLRGIDMLTEEDSIWNKI